MKMNCNQHLPIEIYDSIEDHYMDCDYYDDHFDDDYSYDRNYYGAYMYCYVEEFDKIIFNAGIKEDYETSSELYCDSEGNLFTAYPYFDDKKIIALTGAVINAINNIKKPSKKLTKLYNKNVLNTRDNFRSYLGLEIINKIKYTLNVFNYFY